MKKFALLFSILFLFAFVTNSFAAEIKLIDNSTTSEKLISVLVDTKGQSTENVKVVIRTSDDVTISEIREADVNCSTFSSAPNTNIAEIICTLSSGLPISGKLAEVVFTTTSDSYDFAIDKTQSQIGDLTIDSVVDIGEIKLEETVTNSETTEDVDTTEEETPTQPVTTPTTVKKTTGFMSFLPFILLGAAGIFLLTIIVLLITKKKDDITPNGLETLASTPLGGAIPSLINPQPQEVIQQQIESIPTDVPTIEAKPTLEQLVSQSSEVQSNTNKNEINDLEALLVSENPSLNTIPQEPVVPTPVVEVQPTIEPENTGYTANISAGGLPEVGSTSPMEVSNQISPNLGPIEQPINNEVPIIDITTPNPIPEINQTGMGMGVEIPDTSPLSAGFPLDETLPQVNPEPSLEQPVAEPIINEVPIIDITTSNPIPEINQTGMGMGVGIPDTSPLSAGFPLDETLTQAIPQPSIQQPIENQVPQTNTETIDGDLQNLVNQEISSIPIIPTNTAPQNPTTPINPIEPMNPI